MARTGEELLAGLPGAFRYGEALDYLSGRQFWRLIGDGEIVALSRGLCRKSGWLGDVDLVEIAARRRWRRCAFARRCPART